MTKKGLMSFIAFLILASSAYAQDFSIYPGKFLDSRQEEKIEFEFYNGTYSICENEKNAIPILVVNEGAQSRFSINAFGAGWLKLNVREFSLARRQNGVVLLELDPVQNSEGSYSIIASAASGSQRKELRIDVRVEKCFSIELQLGNDDEKTCGGIKKQYGGLVVNSGEQEIDVELKANGPNWISIDRNEFSVSPNEAQGFQLNADIPANARGIFTIGVSASAKSSDLKAEEEMSIDVAPKYDCYRAGIIINPKISNYYSDEYVPVKIMNSGIKRAVYDISLEAPEWVTVEPAKLALNPGELGNVNLHVNPKADVNEGTYPVKLHARHEDNVYSKNIDISLSRGRLLKNLKSFFDFYKYYIYAALIILAILLVFRKRISGSAQAAYKNYKIRQSRLNALKSARKKRELKKQLKELRVKTIQPGKNKNYSKTGILLIILIIAGATLFFSVYQFDFPAPKEFFREYSAYLAAGILISAFIIFLVEFYRPLFRMLKKIK